MRALLLRWLLFLAGYFVLSRGQSCTSSSALVSCGQCIKESSECAWCGDAEFVGSFRCDSKRNLRTLCRQIFQPKSEISLTQDVELGSVKPYTNGTRVQLQPQVVNIKIRPGEVLQFSLQYLHLRQTVETIYALNSELESKGFSISYSVDCKGVFQDGAQCDGVRHSDTVTYNVSVRLTECKSSGDAVASIGVGGVRDVVAVYISPICGCECEKLEKQEQRSARCSGYGTLVCGKCVCDPGRGGEKCQCGTGEDGTGMSPDMENQCRRSPGEPLCSGRGKCDCGVCKCESYYSGNYCECDDTSCEVYDGIMCSGHGKCKCGTCNCDSGWTGRACDCSLSTYSCTDDQGGLCNGRGICECNKCTCHGGYSGDLCQVEPTTETAPVTEAETEAPEETVEPETEAVTEAEAETSTVTEEKTTPSAEENVETENTNKKSNSLRFSIIFSVFLPFFLFAFLLSW